MQIVVPTTFILLLSPAGGGKTTLIRNTVPVLSRRGKTVSIIFNDDGDPDAVDMPEEVRKYADLATMTSGCFGCADADALVTKMQELVGVVDYVFVEPIGFTAAGEMVNVFGRVGVTPTIVTLIDAAHLEANLRIGTLEGQVAAADIVLLTKVTNHTRAEAHTFAKAHALIDTLIQEHGVSEALILKEPKFKVRAIKPRIRGGKKSHVCTHEGCQHTSSNVQARSHIHIVPKHVRLTKKTTLKHVVECMDERVIRAKGVVGTTRFSMVHGDWAFEEGGAQQANFVTYYTLKKEESEGVANVLMPYVLELRYASLGTADEVRAHADQSLFLETLKRCEEAPLTLVRGFPISNPEWQELLNELRKRPGISEELQAQAVRARVRHFIRCGEWFLNNPITTSDPSQGGVLLVIAIGIAWFFSEQPTRLTEELNMRAVQLPLAQWLAMGLLSRTKTNSDLGREEVMAEEAGITAFWCQRFAKKEENDKGRLQVAYEHSLTLAKKDGRTQVLVRWTRVEKQFI
jgi:G3E family GTPase